MELSTVCQCAGKMKALLAAKLSPVRWGSQMCLNVGGVHFFCLYVANCLLCRFFTLAPNVWHCRRR
jgi:hypothetical protein